MRSCLVISTISSVLGFSKFSIFSILETSFPIFINFFLLNLKMCFWWSKSFKNSLVWLMWAKQSHFIGYWCQLLDDACQDGAAQCRRHHLMRCTVKSRFSVSYQSL